MRFVLALGFIVICAWVSTRIPGYWHYTLGFAAGFLTAGILAAP